jgi:hypothetical protein
MEPVVPRSFPPVEAGALLAVVTLLCLGAGALVGWAAGSLKLGLVIGAVVGLPAGVSSIYLRYHTYFS